MKKTNNNSSLSAHYLGRYLIRVKRNHYIRQRYYSQFTMWKHERDSHQQHYLAIVIAIITIVILYSNTVLFIYTQ